MHKCLAGTDVQRRKRERDWEREGENERHFLKEGNYLLKGPFYRDINWLKGAISPLNILAITHTHILIKT